ncbi:MAG TPA: type II secretion system F family protein [Phycisphaerae bacterium]|nr:type II secretion system F family protein [Phycisphaerae bacterium]
MVNWPIIVLKGAAAGFFGVAVALLAAAAWALVRREQVARAGVGMTSIRRAEMRRQAVADSPAFGLVLPVIAGVAGVVSRLGLDPLRSYVHDPYVRAGYPGGLDDDEVVASGALLSVVFVGAIALVAVGLFGLGFAWMALIGFPLGFMALVAHFKSAAKEREVEIMRALPYALDLLVLMLRSGTSLRIALLRVIEDYQGHALGTEFGQVLAEVDVGSPRAEAFKKMAGRLKIPDVTALVDALVQSEELGWPLADTLEGLADRLNAERMLRAQSTAGAAGVYVMLPSTLVLLSAVLLLFAPFIVRYLVTGTLAD